MMVDVGGAIGSVLLLGVDDEVAYRWFHEGSGTASIDANAEGWRQVVKDYSDALVLVVRGLAESRASWAGAAGDAAHDAVSPVRSWAEHALDSAMVAQAAVSEQSRAFADIKARLSPPVVVPDKPWFNDVWPGETNYDRALDAKQANSIHNVELVRQYGDLTEANSVGYPLFDVPVELTTDVSQEPVRPRDRGILEWPARPTVDDSMRPGPLIGGDPVDGGPRPSTVDDPSDGSPGRVDPSQTVPIGQSPPSATATVGPDPAPGRSPAGGAPVAGLTGMLRTGSLDGFGERVPGQRNGLPGGGRLGGGIGGGSAGPRGGSAGGPGGRGAAGPRGGSAGGSSGGGAGGPGGRGAGERPGPGGRAGIGPGGEAVAGRGGTAGGMARGGAGGHPGGFIPAGSAAAGEDIEHTNRFGPVDTHDEFWEAGVSAVAPQVIGADEEQ